MGRVTPTILRWQLGQRLRSLREQAGVSPKAAADAIEVSPATLSKIENGKQQVRKMYVRVLAALLDVDDGTRDELLALVDDANQPEWYVALASRAPKWFRQYLGYEAAAVDIRVYCAELIDGRMQTEEYARAIGLAGQPDAAPSDLDGYVALRRGRQARLIGEDPPTLDVVMNEVVLHRLVGGPAVMRRQLEQVAELSEYDHITVRILPFSAGAHPAMTAPFELLGLEVDEMSTVYLENGRGAVYLDAKADRDRYSWVYDRLVDLSLSPAKSRDLLVRVASDL